MSERPAFAVEPTREAEKDLLRLRPWTAQATQAVFRRENDPYLGHSLTGSLKGARALGFTLKGGGYRALYVVLEETRTCLVFIVGPHENIYEQAERRLTALRRAGRI